MASPEMCQGCSSVDMGTSSQASLQGWKKPLVCTTASSSPCTRRLSGAGNKDKGSVRGSMACPSHKTFPIADMGATGLISVPAKH